MKKFFSAVFLISLAACATLSKLDRQKISVDETMKSNRSNFIHCFENQKQKPLGKLLVWLIIDEDGSVKSVSLKESTLNNPIVEQCILREIMALTFQSDLGDERIELSYPFKFTRE